jgi:hypothetical protein
MQGYGNWYFESIVVASNLSQMMTALMMASVVWSPAARMPGMVIAT